MSQNKMPPDRYSQMIKHLTRKKIKNPFTPASAIQRPKKILEIEAFQDFNVRNPKAGGGMLVQPSADGSRPGYAKEKKFTGRNQYGKFQTDKPVSFIDRDLLSRIIEAANNENKFVNEEGISKLYAEATGQTNVTKRKYRTGGKDKILTYKKIDSPTIKLASKNTTLGYLETREDKVKKVFQEVLSMDGPIPKVNLGKYENRRMADYKKYIISETGIGTVNVDKIVKSLPSYKKNKDAFTFLEKGGLMKTDLVDMSLADQLKYADSAKDGKPVYTKLKGINFADPNYLVMDFALRNWNANKGKGNIKFYDANGKKITWKNGLELPLNKISFSQGQSKQKFGIGKSDNFLNVRLVGKDYFPEVYKNVRLISQLKTAKVDNPFKPGTQTSFLNLIKRIYIKEKGYDSKAPLFSVFHGPGGVAKEPFKNLSFGLLELNKAVYEIERSVPLKGLRNKILNQAYNQLKGKSGEKLINAIINEQVNIAREIKKGKNPIEGSLRERTFKKVLETESLGTREREFLERSLASFADSPQCGIFIRKRKADGGRIPYETGTVSLSRCAQEGAKNFQDGKFKTADQVQDAAKLLRGGRLVINGLMKYGIIPELAYVGLEAAGRTLLGEKITNSLLKSIDTFTFGATDFGSGIEAEKFGKFSDQKLAVDKFRNSQALVNSLQSKLKNLQDINDQGGEGYVGDLSSDIQVTQAQLQRAQKSLQENTVSSDIIQFIDRKGQEIADTQMAKSDFAKQSLKDQMEGIPGIRDYTDTESTRIFPTQPSQMDLNLNMFPTLPTNLMQFKTLDAIDLAQALRAEGQNVSAKDVLAYRDELKSTPLSELAKTYGDEQVYGTQGADVLQPLAGGGIAGLSGGKKSGPAPISGPTPHGDEGLPAAFKRVKKQ